MNVEFYTISELKMLPSPSLAALKKTQSLTMSAITSRVKSLEIEIANLSGITKVNTGSVGGLVSVPQWEGLLPSGSILQGALNSLDSVSTTMRTLQDNGVDVFEGDTLPDEDSLNSVISKVERDTSQYIINSSLITERKKAKLSNLESQLELGLSQVNVLKANLDAITSIVGNRATGSLGEPSLNYEGMPVGPDPVSEEHQEFLSRAIITPWAADHSKWLQVQAQLNRFLPGLEPTYDLIHGPPISSIGRYVLSENGFYYDSRSTKEAPSPNGKVPSDAATSFNYAPNLGGRGEVYKEEDLDWYTDTIMDFENAKETDELLQFYYSDNILQNFIADRQKEIYDVSGQIQELLEKGHEEKGPLVTNYNQQLGGIYTSYELKIKKRKKQLELARLSGRFEIVGGEEVLFFKEDGTKEVLKHIPVNDFSFTKNMRLRPTLGQQVSITLGKGDVDDSVLPLDPLYLNTLPKEGVRTFEHLALANEGAGVGPHYDKTKGQTSLYDVSGEGYLTRNITDSVITKGLEAGFAFLNPLTGSSTSIDDYQIDNFGANGLGVGNAQMLANDLIEVYPSGLSIPFLRGSDLINGGACVQIPVWEDLISGLYSKAGFTFSVWTHIPKLESDSFFDDDHTFRLLLACENTGEGGQTDLKNYVNADMTVEDAKVRGFVFGFVRGVQGKPLLGLYPTVSQNERRLGWDPSVCFGENENKERLGVSWVPPSIDLEEDLTSSFRQITFTVNPLRKEVKIFYDGKLQITESVKNVFGLGIPKSPTFHTLNHTNPNLVSYSASSGVAPSILPGSSFTPFILGGGYTDTLETGGFMGSNTNSYYSRNSSMQEAALLNNNNSKSGLFGFIGLPLLYSRALTEKEVLKNFNQTKAFFKNIKLD